MATTTSSPIPPSSIPLDILKWHQDTVNDAIKDARERLEKQMLFYVAIFGFAFLVCAALLTLAGWLGYKNALSIVEASFTESVRAELVRKVTPGLEAKIMAQIVKDEQLGVDQMLKDADQKYVRVGEYYALYDQQHKGYASILDEGQGTFTATATNGKPMVSISTPGQFWSIVARGTAPR